MQSIITQRATPSLPEGHSIFHAVRAPQVYESLRRSPDFPEEKLAAFDGEDAEELLYEMRNLGVNLRAVTAEYIADNGLDAYVRVLATPCLLHTLSVSFLGPLRMRLVMTLETCFDASSWASSSRRQTPCDTAGHGPGVTEGYGWPAGNSATQVCHWKGARIEGL